MVNLLDVFTLQGVSSKDIHSHVIFILFAEVLSRSMNSLFKDKDFREYGMSKWSSPLNHLAYTDNTIIFSFTNLDSLKKVMMVYTKMNESYAG